MSVYKIIKREVIERVYEVQANSKGEAVDKVGVFSSDIKELAVPQGFYKCEYTANKSE